MTSDGTAKWVPARRAAQSPLRVGSETFLSDYIIIASRKDRRKKILLNRTFRPHGLPQQTENRVGREGVTYRYRDNETSVPRCQVR